MNSSTPSAAFIGAVIILEAGPVHHYLMSSLRGRPIFPGLKIWFVLSFSTAFILSLLAVFLPMPGSLLSSPTSSSMADTS